MHTVNDTHTQDKLQERQEKRHRKGSVKEILRFSIPDHIESEIQNLILSYLLLRFSNKKSESNLQPASIFLNFFQNWLQQSTKFGPKNGKSTRASQRREA